MNHPPRDQFDLEIDPDADPAESLQKISESRARVGCLGCVVTGAPAIAAVAGAVLLLLYLIGRFT